MQLSTAYKQKLLSAARIASAGAIIVSSVGTIIAPQSFASQLTLNSLKVTDSAPSTTNVTYTETLQPPSTSLSTAINRVDFKVCTLAGQYSDACTPPAGFDFGTATGWTADGFGSSSSASPMTPTKDTANTAHIVITTPAAESAIDHHIIFNAVTNPSGANSYYIRTQTASDSLGSTPIDSGEAAFAIISKVSVSGRVLENLSFQVAAVTSGTTCGTSGDVASITSTATTVPFGNFNSGTPIVVCQQIKTITNALNGYTATVHETLGGATPQGGMCRQTAANCSSDGGNGSVSASDVIVDATLNGTPATWTNGTTFGVGVNSNGGEHDSAWGASNTYRSLFGATPIAVADTTGATAGSFTNVVYKADVPGNQIAGVYQNTLEYVATPKF